MEIKDTGESSETEGEQMLRNGGKHGDYKEDTKEDDRSRLPVDRGWAWAVLAGVALYLFLFGAVRKNFGLFFVAFQERYNTNASVTSLVATIQNVIISIASLLIMTIGMHYMSNRTSILIGGVIKTVATMIAAFSTDVRLLFFSIGIVDGIGIAFAQNPVISMLGEYFHKKRGTANGMAFCCASFGALIFAPILTTLFEDHGYVGTMLIAAGMSFNCCVTGALMRPLTFYTKKRKLPLISDNISDDKPKETLIMKDLPTIIKNGERDPPFRSLDLIPNSVSALKKEHGQLFRMNSYDAMNASKSQNNRVRTFSENSQTGNLSSILKSLSHSKISIYASTSGVGGSLADVHRSVERALSQTETIQSQTKQTCCSSFKRQTTEVLKIIFDVSLFKTAVFPCIIVLGFMMVSGGDCVLIMLPPHAKDIGLSNDQRGVLLLIFSCFDLVSRIVLTLIADRPWIRRTTILAIAGIVLGLACHLLRFFGTYASMIVFCIVTGSCSQLYWAMHAVILVDYLTVAKLKSSLGFMTVCHGFAISIMLPVAGSIRDSTGTYIATYHLLGSILMCGGAMAFSLPYVDKYAKKKAGENMSGQELTYS